MEDIEDQILNEILKDTFTLESFKVRVMALKHSIEARLYESGEEKRATESEGSGSTEKTEQWLEKFNAEITKSVTGDNFNAVFSKAEGFISQTNTLTIYFVFNPDEEQIEEIGEWLRTNLKNPRLVFSVKVNPALIGGCAIVHKGVYKDLSLRARIEENKGRLVEEFRKYLRN